MKTSNLKTYNEAMEYLLQIIDYEKLANYKYDLTSFDLNRMVELLSVVGSPHKGGAYVHITGTKGKGSTAMMIASILKGSGLRTGLFTSPHLTHLGERIRINGRMMSQKIFVQLVNELKPYIEMKCREGVDHSPTFFEVVTAIALIYFHRKNVDISVLEVGMGGRLDSTNVVLPKVSVITSIDYDHTDKLGSTLDKIAYEKAGIIKDGVPVVSSIQEHDALQTIAGACKERKSKLYLVGRDIIVNQIKNTKINGIYGVKCDISTWKNKYKNIFLPLIGRHQAENCAVAIGAIEVLAGNGVLRAGSNKIKEALTHVKCRARIEVVSRRPYIIVDTAHTVTSMKALRESIKESLNYKKFILVFGISSDKDIEGILREITGTADELIFTRTGNPREATPKQLASIAGKCNKKKSRIFESINDAVKEAKRVAGRDDLICITGSFYLAGKVKEILQKNLHF